MTGASIDVSVWRQYAQTHSPQLREELAVAHIPLVKYVASRMLPTLHESVEHRELVSYGMIGLLDAIERYDPETGHAFSTYAVHRIQGAITDEMRAQAWEPRSVRARSRRLMEAISCLERELGRTPGEAEVAARMEVTVTEVRRIEADMRNSYVKSLSTPIGHDSDGTAAELGETIAAPDSDMEINVMELQARMAASIGRLPQRDRDLLEWVYVRGLSFRAIAQALQVSESWVSQLHTQAMVSIQRAMAGAYA